MPSRSLLAMGPIAFSELKPQNKPGKPFPVWGEWNRPGHLLSKHRQTHAGGVKAGGDEGPGATRWRCDYRDPHHA